MLDYSLKCTGYENNSKGDVSFYFIDVIFNGGRLSEKIKLTPSQIVSFKHFKIAMINRRIPYPATRKEHHALTSTLFSHPMDSA